VVFMAFYRGDLNDCGLQYCANRCYGDDYIDGNIHKLTKSDILSYTLAKIVQYLLPKPDHAYV
jgi:hypothetical protein